MNLLNLIIIDKLFNTSICTVAAPEGQPGNVPPSETGKFSKDGEQSTPQPAMRIDYRKIFKFSLNFSKFLLKFS